MPPNSLTDETDLVAVEPTVRRKERVEPSCADPLLSQRQFCRLHHVSPSTVRKARNAGAPFIRLGSKHVRIEPNAFLAWLRTYGAHLNEPQSSSSDEPQKTSTRRDSARNENGGTRK